ncbi:MAG: hypothetical protein QE271_12680 [Bacteriovoracaceae bacterium]|nr:hypothetical protein [Bacteriovoracaceae bacterium]
MHLFLFLFGFITFSFNSFADTLCSQNTINLISKWYSEISTQVPEVNIFVQSHNPPFRQRVIDYLYVIHVAGGPIDEKISFSQLKSKAVIMKNMINELADQSNLKIIDYRNYLKKFFDKRILGIGFRNPETTSIQDLYQLSNIRYSNYFEKLKAIRPGRIFNGLLGAAGKNGYINETEIADPEKIDQMLKIFDKCTN